MGGGRLSARLLNASYGPDLQEINRACPIVSDLTFWFDRGDNFFRWPELVYDRFFYVGVFAGGDLVGYCMVGLTRAWTGRDLGWLAVLGDARVLPEHRGLGWIDVAPEATRAGGRRHDGDPCGPRLPGAIPRSRVARPLFAPETSPQALENSIRRPGLGWERTYLARRDEDIVGVLGAWDTGAFHATRVVSYSAAATIARGVHAAARTVLREGAPLPEPGEAFRSLTITNLAVRGGDPRVLRALLSAVNNDHVSQGFHLMHLGATAGEDWAPALRGWLRQRFSSSLYTLTRTGGPEPPEGSLSNPYLDLSII